ncbi:hypothetical protein [Streptomyces sp. NBC_01264]|uniref:hypothetical protein n=1 Tax=Streptomyces sp. NBC_01264 TaxID=2903804 RepID=UPI00224EEFF6|nr:hypothetical protein [Streptomyces sp. NBC_01264]MCX4784596.1 hypothetical protein [Streptomyces sp. NBC_01264]
MRYTRTALAIATTLLALTTLGGTTAHADDTTKRNNCTITIGTIGDHSNIACGNITFGDHATTGQGHTTGGLGALPPTTAVYTITNHSTQELTCTGICNATIPATTPTTPTIPGTATVRMRGNGTGTLETPDQTIATLFGTTITEPSGDPNLPDLTIIVIGCQPKSGWTCTVNGGPKTITVTPTP